MKPGFQSATYPLAIALDNEKYYETFNIAGVFSAV